MAPVLMATLSAPARSSTSTSGHAADPAADGQRDEDGLGGPADHLERGLSTFDRCRDVEEGQLVGALGVVDGAELDRVARIAEVDEVDPLDHPAVMHVQAGDDADRNTHGLHPNQSHRQLSSHILPADRSKPAGRPRVGRPSLVRVRAGNKECTPISPERPTRNTDRQERRKTAMDLGISDRVALVSGADSGIGTPPTCCWPKVPPWSSPTSTSPGWTKRQAN